MSTDKFDDVCSTEYSDVISSLDWTDAIKRAETDDIKSLLTRVADSFRMLNVPTLFSSDLFSTLESRTPEAPPMEPRGINNPITPIRIASTHWLTPTELASPKSEPLHQLLYQIKSQSGIASRRYAAAAFLLRYSWICSVWMAPFYVDNLIPLTTPNQVKLMYNSNGFLHALSFDGTARAAHKVGALGKQGDIKNSKNSGYMTNNRETLPHYRTLDEGMRLISDQLLSHHKPMVERLHQWSRYSYQALWAMCSTTWFTNLLYVLRALSVRPEEIEAQLTAFYHSLNSIAPSLPSYYPFNHSRETHYFVTNKGCCLYFKGESRHFCMNCPLITPEERLQRNRACIEYLKER